MLSKFKLAEACINPNNPFPLVPSKSIEAQELIMLKHMKEGKVVVEC
jgi:hypothetical protein